MAKADVVEVGKKTRFSKDRQPEKSGRKKNRFTHLAGLFELSAADVSNIIEYQLSLSSAELDAIIKNKENTVLEQAFAVAIKDAVLKKDLSQIEKLLDRKIGRVSNNIDLTSGGKPLPVSINIKPVSNKKNE